MSLTAARTGTQRSSADVVAAREVDLVVRRARLFPRAADGLVDVALADGLIVDVGPSLAVVGPEIDAGGRLVVPGLVETHLHLDKSRVPDDRADEGGGLAGAMARTAEAKASFTPDEVFDRACLTLAACMTHGTTKVRTQVELDPVVELRGFEGVLAARDAFAGQVDIEICVFPQEGLALDSATEDLLIEGLKRGATAIGGAPYTDRDPRAQIDTVFALAERFDVDIDMHLDLSETIDDMQIEYVCRKTEEARLGGRVTVGHVTQLSLLPADEVDRIARMLADAGVAVTVLPSTDLFLMGRSTAQAKPRGLAPLGALRERGVICSISTNNVLNSFTPYGDGSLIRQANLYANVAHVAESAGLADCLSMVTDQAASIIGCDDYGFGIGTPADLVLLDALDPASAIAQITPAVWGVKSGRMSFQRPDVIVHARERSSS